MLLPVNSPIRILQTTCIMIDCDLYCNIAIPGIKKPVSDTPKAKATTAVRTYQLYVVHVTLINTRNRDVTYKTLLSGLGWGLVMVSRALISQSQGQGLSSPSVL